MRILILDDKEENCEAAQAQFAGTGHEVTVFCTKIREESQQTDVENILRSVSDVRFDVVLTDMLMPIGKRMLDGNINYPMGWTIALVAVAQGTPIVAALSSRDAHGPSFAMNHLGPALSTIFDLDQNLFGSSFLQHSQEFTGVAPPGSPRVYSWEEKKEIQRAAGWSSEKMKELDDAIWSANKDHTPAACDAERDYKAIDPCKDFRQVKNWRGFLIELITRDPAQRYVRELPSLIRTPPAGKTAALTI